MNEARMFANPLNACLMTWAMNDFEDMMCAVVDAVEVQQARGVPFIAIGLNPVDMQTMLSRCSFTDLCAQTNAVEIRAYPEIPVGQTYAFDMRFMPEPCNPERFPRVQ